ncbi:3'-5' exonuclease [Pelomyxa schiedti]|nr:3'-5' exonuclease [Pelomyxa schiedti]
MQPDAAESSPTDTATTTSTNSTGTPISTTASGTTGITFDELTSGITQSLVAATRACNGLPVGDDYYYYNALPAFNNKTSESGRRLLSLTQRLMSLSKRKASRAFQPYLAKFGTMYGNSEGGGWTVDEREELSSKYSDTVIDVDDTLLEFVDQLADDASLKIAKKQDPALIKTDVSVSGQAEPCLLLHTKNVERPQNKWAVKNRNTPFVPQITRKPFALVPLHPIYLGKTEKLPDEEYPHPYQYELSNLSPTVWQSEICKPQIPPSLERTPLHMIDTPEQLAELIQVLEKESIFAVDLEAHDYRTYEGFVCLCQISTRSTDYIIDTLKLHFEMNTMLDVFVNPAILKVFHGSDWDILWLQRDFGIYVVNMFDTGQAARVLEYGSYALKYLLDKFCHIDVDKSFQLADWRIRPLPEEMKKYAREDTHYLLYVYDMMKNELIARGNSSLNLITAVFQRSREICLRMYQKRITNDQSYTAILPKIRAPLTNIQLKALKNLYLWRDGYARNEDESTRYILPDYMLIQIAMVCPTDTRSLLSCCSPVPPSVRLCSSQILEIIKEAKATADTEMPRQLDVVAAPPKRTQPDHLRWDQDDEVEQDTVNDDQVDDNLITSKPEILGTRTNNISIQSPILIKSGVFDIPMPMSEEDAESQRIAKTVSDAVSVPLPFMAQFSQPQVPDIEPPPEEPESPVTAPLQPQGADILKTLESQESTVPVDIIVDRVGKSDTAYSLITKKTKKRAEGKLLTVVDVPDAESDSQDEAEKKQSGAFQYEEPHRPFEIPGAQPTPESTKRQKGIKKNVTQHAPFTVLPPDLPRERGKQTQVAKVRKGQDRAASFSYNNNP